MKLFAIIYSQTRLLLGIIYTTDLFHDSVRFSGLKFWKFSMSRENGVFFSAWLKSCILNVQLVGAGLSRVM